MIRLEIGGWHHDVGPAELVVGSGEACQIRLAGEGIRERHASVRMMDDGSVAIQLADPSAEVYVNGIRLGSDPTPVLHGDKITVAGEEILVVEASNIGSTQHINVADLVGVVPGPGQGREETSAGPLTGGRLVCLTDGREYSVGDNGVFFGREAGSDIVVTSGEVSRRHAQILPTPQGYVINDSSTNGTFVNGERIAGSRILSRADVVRIGDDEFRFYAEATAEPAPPAAPPADEAAAAPPAPPADEAPAAAPPAPPAPAPARASSTAPGTPPPGAAERLNNTMMGLPAFKPSDLAPPPPSTGTPPAKVLATLLVRKGPLKGERFAVRVPIANVGRAEYNDVVLADASVSQAHAKLQRRDNVWVVTDLGSTNGTTVDDVPVEEETPLSPGSTITFGEVPLLFDPSESDLGDEAPGTRVIPALEVDPPVPTRDHEVDEPPAPRPAPKIVASGGGSSSSLGKWVVAILLLAIVAVVIFVLLGMR